jgi:hypothetical protein
MHNHLPGMPRTFVVPLRFTKVPLYAALAADLEAKGAQLTQLQLQHAQQDPSYIHRIVCAEDQVMRQMAAECARVLQQDPQLQQMVLNKFELIKTQAQLGHHLDLLDLHCAVLAFRSAVTYGGQQPEQQLHMLLARVPLGAAAWITDLLLADLFPGGGAEWEVLRAAGVEMPGLSQAATPASQPHWRNALLKALSLPMSDAALVQLAGKIRAHITSAFDGLTTAISQLNQVLADAARTYGQELAGGAASVIPSTALAAFNIATHMVVRRQEEGAAWLAGLWLLRLHSSGSASSLPCCSPQPQQQQGPLLGPS